MISTRHIIILLFVIAIAIHSCKTGKLEQSQKVLPSATTASNVVIAQNSETQKPETFISNVAKGSIVIKGKTIPLEEMAFNEAYIVEREEGGRGYKLAFASKNKKRIVFSEYKSIEDESIIEMYDETGMLLWKQSKKAYCPSKVCNIADDGSFTNVVWHTSDEEMISYVGQILISYNKEGKEIFQDDNIQYIYTGVNNNSIVYYKKDANSAKNPDLEGIIFCINLSTGQKWNKTFDNLKFAGITSISETGENIICNSDKTYALNNEGKILWEKDWSTYKYPGIFAISGDGKHTVRAFEKNKLCLYSNLDGNEIFCKDSMNIDNKNFAIINGCFINGDPTTFALIGLIEYHKFFIIFINTEGLIKYYAYKDADTKFHNLYVEIGYKNEYVVYFDKIKTYEINL